MTLKHGPMLASALAAAIFGVPATLAYARVGLNASDFADDATKLVRPDAGTASGSKALGPQICDSEAELRAGAQIDEFCAHPYETICGSSTDSEARLSTRFESLRDKIRASAHQDLQAAYAALDQELGIPSDTWKLRWQDRIQRQLIAAIGAQPGLTDEQKKKLQARIDHTEIIDGRQILEGERQDLLPNLEKQCGKDGLKRNAFQPPGTNVVVLCPGLIASAWAGRDEAFGNPDLARTDLLSRLTFTLAHEISHQADAEAFPIEHRNLRACMDSRYSSSFAAVAKEPGATPTRHQELLDGYMEEISADTWGTETLAQEISATRLRSQAFNALKRSLNALCSFMDDGSHPSDQFRINVIVGRNPRLRQALGCVANSAEAPGCVIEGRVPAK